MKTVPSANAAWMESVVRVFDDVDINVVTGAGDSLSQPVLRNCAEKGLRALSAELNAAAPLLTDEDRKECRRLEDEAKAALKGEIAATRE